MPNPINNITLQSTYIDAATIQDVYGGRGGTFEVAGGPFYYSIQYGSHGFEYWSEDAYSSPGVGAIEAGAIGVRFKTAGTGTAVASARIAPPTQPILTLTASTASTTAMNIVPTSLASWPPSSPADGDLQVLELPASYDPIGGKKLRWLCQYNAGDAIWDVLDGAPLYAEVATKEADGSAAYGDLATVGPQLTLPRPGDYQIEAGWGNDGNGGGENYMAYAIGSTAAADADATIGIAGTSFSVTRRRYKTGLSNVTVTAKYRNAASNGFFQSRWLSIDPVRIS